MSFELIRGQRPLLISMPHIGTDLPVDTSAGMQSRARLLVDTDWHLERLYDFTQRWNVSLLLPRVSRYVIDLNRPPDGTALYPGDPNAGTTELCPTTTFDGEPLYRPGCEPDAGTIDGRRERYWQPYHDALRGELERLRDTHKEVVLFEAHSIRSEIPRLFTGKLPDLNLGTFDGRSCDPHLQSQLEACLSRPGTSSENRSDGGRDEGDTHSSAERDEGDTHSGAEGGEGRGTQYSLAINGRFKGGYITRAYGTPDAGVHAVQLELAQANYMQEQPPFSYDPLRAEQLQPLLEALLMTILAWAEHS